MWSESSLSEIDLAYAAACMTAAKELGIAAQSPFSLERNGVRFVYAIHFPNFGGGNGDSFRRGLVGRVGGEPFDPRECGEIWEVAAEQGYFAWNQAPGAINTNAQELANWLNCFSWQGLPADRPRWHTAEYYDELWREPGSA